jgi:hypothetical protein
MLISPSGGWRSITARWIVWWLSDRVEEGLFTGYAIWWVVAATLDGLYQMALEGVWASWPGFGTPTALSLIGRSRGMIRGMQESDDSYALRMISWLTRWHHAGSQENLIQAIYEYCLGQPPCFIVNRSGTRVSVASDGTMTTDVITWDWDSLTNPERAGFWSELWIVVFYPPWAIDGSTLPAWEWGQPDPGYGHLSPRVDVDAIKGMLVTGPSQHSAHSYVRAIIWSYDPTLFNPSNPSTMPDGTWGEWGYSPTPNAAFQQSGRFLSCRYWEPEPDPNPLEWTPPSPPP